MPPIPSIVFATPTIDVPLNGIVSLVVGSSRWHQDRILDCSLIFRRESAYDSGRGAFDPDATAVLLANNSLHYGRTADVERFFVAYGDSDDIPLGVGFGSFGGPQSWTNGFGPWIEIPEFVPVIGGRRFVTFQDDRVLDPLVDGRVVPFRGKYILPWNALEMVTGNADVRRLYVSTPNHQLDFVNRNSNMPHVEQRLGTGAFQQLVELPSGQFANEEDVARRLPDESDPNIRDAVRAASSFLFGRNWLF